MRITITAELSDESLTYIAILKGYSAKALEMQEKEQPGEKEGEVVTVLTAVEVDNPLTMQDFIMKIYEGIIKNDIKQLLIQEKRKEIESSMRDQEAQIEQLVDSSITSTIS